MGSSVSRRRAVTALYIATYTAAVFAVAIMFTVALFGVCP